MTTTLILRLEGAALAAASLWFFPQSGLSWWWLVPLLLWQDVAIAGYWLGAQTGAWLYNLTHQAVVPTLGVAVALVMGLPVLLGLCLAWLAHIGIDRMLGYGLKHASGFADTHLGRIGRSGA